MSSSLPREPGLGQPLSTGWGQQIQRHLSGLRKSGIKPRAQPQRKSVVSITHPFKITDASDDTGAKVNIQFGLLNNITPTLDDGVTELDTQTEIDLSSAGTWIIYMEVKVVDDETIQHPDYDHVFVVAEIGWTESGSGAGPDQYGYQIIAEVDVVAGEDSDPDAVTEIRQNVTHGLRHKICGRIAEDTESDPPTTFEAGTHEFWGV